MASVGGQMSHSTLSINRSRVPLSRGMITGGLLVLLGIWGGLVPFLGPQFGYAYTPDSAWTWTWGRLWLEVLPAAAALLGGLGIASTTSRSGGVVASWLAVLGGAWFVVGPTLSVLWGGGTVQSGTPAAVSAMGRAVQEIGFFYGLGAVILFLGALSLGRFTAFNRVTTTEPEPEATRVPPTAEGPTGTR